VYRRALLSFSSAPSLLVFVGVQDADGASIATVFSNAHFTILTSANILRLDTEADWFGVEFNASSGGILTKLSDIIFELLTSVRIL
jgi:hypothetical protein